MPCITPNGRQKLLVDLEDHYDWTEQEEADCFQRLDNAKMTASSANWLYS